MTYWVARTPRKARHWNDRWRVVTHHGYWRFMTLRGATRFWTLMMEHGDD